MVNNKPKKAIEPIDGNIDDVAKSTVIFQRNSLKLSRGGSFYVKEQEIHILEGQDVDYISLTDIAKSFENSKIIISR